MRLTIRLPYLRNSSIHYFCVCAEEKRYHHSKLRAFVCRKKNLSWNISSKLSRILITTNNSQSLKVQKLYIFSLLQYYSKKVRERSEKFFSVLETQSTATDLVALNQIGTFPNFLFCFLCFKALCNKKGKNLCTHLKLSPENK